MGFWISTFRLMLKNWVQMQILHLINPTQKTKSKCGPANVLLHNQGTARFERAKNSGLEVYRHTYQSTWCDFDKDGDPDIRATLPEVKSAFDLGETVFIDSRSSQMFDEGHIRGALNIPASKPIPHIKETLSDLPKDTPIITYCYGGGCRSSLGLAKLLVEQFGFQNVRVFHGGWPDWATSGYPITINKLP